MNSERAVYVLEHGAMAREEVRRHSTWYVGDLGEILTSPKLRHPYGYKDVKGSCMEPT